MKWQPTPVFLLEKSHGQKAWQATVQEVSKEQDKTEQRKEKEMYNFQISVPVL